jgi:hypothetical protein
VVIQAEPHSPCTMACRTCWLIGVSSFIRVVGVHAFGLVLSEDPLYLSLGSDEAAVVMQLSKSFAGKLSLELAQTQ